MTVPFWQKKKPRSMDILAILMHGEPAEGSMRLRGSRYAFVPLLMAIHASVRGNLETANSLLDWSRSMHPGLKTQELCAAWFRFLRDIRKERKSPKDPNDAPDRAEQAVRTLETTLEQNRAGWLVRLSALRPIMRMDAALTRAWLPLLRLAAASVRTTVDDDLYRRCTEAYRTARAQTRESGVVAALYIPLSHTRALQTGNMIHAERAAVQWARLNRPERKHSIYLRHRDPSYFMRQNMQHLMLAGWTRRALRAGRRYLSVLPEDYELLVMAARVALHSGDYQSGIRHCDRAIEAREKPFSAYCIRSNAHFLVDNTEQALNDADAACACGPDRPQGYIARAYVLLHAGKYSDALPDFDEALRLDPTRNDARQGRGKCLSFLGRDQEAMQCFARLRRRHPEDPDFAYELADVMFAGGYLDDALRECRACVRLDPGYSEAHVLMAVIAMQLNRDDDAEDALHKALEADPGSPLALNEMGYLCHLKGHDDEAAEWIQRALEAWPDYSEALYNKAVVLQMQGDLTESEALYDRVLDLVPDHISALIGKADVLTQRSALEEAMALYDAVLRLQPRSVEACMGKATVYRIMGLEEDGRAWHNRAVHLDTEGTGRSGSER